MTRHRYRPLPLDRTGERRYCRECDIPVIDRVSHDAWHECQEILKELAS